MAARASTAAEHGGTTFHFVAEGFAAAYAQALETADGNGVDIAGGFEPVEVLHSPRSTGRSVVRAGVPC